jgi:hypothetical protein
MVDKGLYRPSFLLTAVLLVTTGQVMSAASTCDVEATLPADQPRVGGCLAAADAPCSFTANGGQRIYVRVKNSTIHATPMTLRVSSGKKEDGSPDFLCEAAILLLPQRAQAWSTAVFRDPPIGYRVDVEAGDVDVAQLTAEAFSKQK